MLGSGGWGDVVFHWNGLVGREGIEMGVWLGEGRFRTFVGRHCFECRICERWDRELGVKGVD